MQFDFRQAIAYLDDHTNREYASGGAPVAPMPTAGRTEGLSLGPIRELMSALGDPHKAFRTLHITGTNGKGSVTRYSTRMLKTTGLSVGTFTSPDLERINERIAYDEVPISDDDFARVMSLLANVEPMLEHEPGRFDLLAAVALTWFAELGVDVAVVEVGLLGRFDSTNIVESDVAVMTNVGKDHTDGAEGWQAIVAREKAGIIKPSSHVVLGSPFGELRREVEAEESRGIYEAGTDFDVLSNELAVGGRVVDLRTPYGAHEQLFVPVHGEHQGDNLATAVVAVETFFDRAIETDLINEALHDIELPGRFEIASREPTVILDGAHNLDGARSAWHTLDTEFARLGSWVLVFGMLGGRDPAEMLEAIGAADFDAVIITEPRWGRAVPAQEVAQAAIDLGIEVEVIADPIDAYRRARAVTSDDDVILIAGSLYLIGDVRPTARSVVENDAELSSTELADDGMADTGSDNTGPKNAALSDALAATELLSDE